MELLICNVVKVLLIRSVTCPINPFVTDKRTGTSKSSWTIFADDVGTSTLKVKVVLLASNVGI